jgi:hypothetical protein
MLTRVAGVTASVVAPEIDPDIAEMVVVPTALLSASPPLPIAATAGTDDNHATDEVITFVLPFV